MFIVSVTHPIWSKLEYNLWINRIDFQYIIRKIISDYGTVYISDPINETGICNKGEMCRYWWKGINKIK